MSDQPGMSHDELIAALRRDMAATSAERDAQSRAHAKAELEIAKLEAEAKASSMPDAQIRAGLRAIRDKFAGLFGRRTTP